MKNLMVRRNLMSSPLVELQRDIDRVFGGYMDQDRMSFVPATDIKDTESHSVISMELPGVKKEDIRVELLNDNQLVISGERRNEIHQNENGMERTERSYGHFERIFTLPAGIDPAQIESNYEDGVLKLAIPKVQAVQPRQIKIGEKKGFFEKTKEKVAEITKKAA